MTRRRLFIIIAILASFDMVLGIWYISEHANSDGKGSPWTMHEEAEMADTIPENMVSSKCETNEYHGYFVSKQEAIEGDALSYFSSIKRVKTRIPMNVNDRNAFGNLFDEIIKKAFNAPGGTDFDTTIKRFVNTPTFNRSVADFKKLETEPQIYKTYGNVQGVKVYPVLSSRNFLVMAIDKTSYNGEEKTEQLQFVAYNWNSHNVLYKDDVLNSAHNSELLQLINEEIKHSTEDFEMNEASQLPTEIYLRKRGIYFVYPAGTIAAKSHGIQQVFIFYKHMRACLTPSFKTLIDTNGDFIDYKPIYFKK